MNTLLVYFSLEGNTKFIAEKIAKVINADVVSLTTSKAYPTEGFKKYFWGGKSVVFNDTPQLTTPPVDLTHYKSVIIGTPVWVGTYAPPIKTFINQNRISGKRVAFYACHGGGGAEKCFKNLRQALSDNIIIGEATFKDPQNDKEINASKAVEWALSLDL